MKKLLNTLYITDETAYLSLDGENIVVKMSGDKKQIPTPSSQHFPISAGEQPRYEKHTIFSRLTRGKRAILSPLIFTTIFSPSSDKYAVSSVI